MTQVLDLLSFRQRRSLAAFFLAVATLVSGYAVYGAGLPIWGATVMFVGVIALPVALKWWDDLQQWGLPAFLLSALLMLQGFHFLEHAVQMVQYYLYDRPPGYSLGLISALNIEWVHFLWNVIVLALTFFLWQRGLRGFWGWALLIWTTLHTLEHAYLIVRYLQISSELTTLGLSGFGVSQALPGILGRDGLLAENGLCGFIPGLTTLPRVAIHFVWNLGETVLLLIAAQYCLPHLIRRTTHGG